MDALIRPDGPNGWVAIQDNELHVEDPLENGQAAVINADDTVVVFVDDIAIHTPTEVFSRTPIRIQLPFRVLPEYQCEFAVSPDRCAVSLTVHVQQPGSFVSLPDTPPTHQLLIQASTREAPLTAFAEDIVHHILNELQRQKISHGIQQDQIQAALEHPGQPHVIALGQAPVSPQNQLHYLFALPEPERQAPQGFKLSFPVLRKCKPAEVLVQRERQEQSQPGLSVYAEVLPPRPAPERPLKAGDGSVKIDVAGDRATARIEGIPSFNGHEVRVAPFDLRSEDLPGGAGAMYDIKGSLQVHGGVQAQAKVWVTQHLELAGDVSHAHLEVAECALIHGSVIRSQLTVGGDTAACLRLLQPVSELYARMEQILLILRELRMQVPKAMQADDRLLLVRIIKTQFPTLMAEVDTLWKLNQSLKQLHPRRTMVLKVVMSNLIHLAERQVDERIFVDWLDKLREFLLDLEASEPMQSHIYLNYTQGSEITSCGNIYVLGEGCYNSHLQASGNILFCGSPGYCREGSLKLGGKLLFVPELGSPNGSRLKVTLPTEGQIQVGKLHPGVEIYFGEQHRKHVLEAGADLTIRLQDGQIVFQPRSAS